MATPSATPAPAAAPGPKTITVPDQLQVGFTAGTEAREGAKKVGAYAKQITASVVGIAVLIWAIVALIPYIKEKVPQGDNVSQGAGSQAGTTATARFAGREADGSLPVGIWSETTTIPAGCSVKFNAGIGTLYKVRYRFYTTEWKEHEGKGKGSPSASEIQFMPLQKGVTGIPFSMKCS